ncbi:MAG TPA: hypothetical protein VK826_15070 [Bacteroidia bacterium]|nr:hypothetical protein [Bacteroidia bacterium]
MLKRILAVTLLSVLCIGTKLNAQCAVYFCKLTGNYGFCYGGKSVMAARECAYEQCLENNGLQPIVLAVNEKKGFGAICMGTNYNGDTVIGVSTGHLTQIEADDAAREACENEGALKLKVKERWEDR